VVHYSNLQPTLSAVLVNAPQAFFASLFRPMPWEADVPFKIAASVENVVLLLLTLAALTKIPYAVGSRHRFLLFSTMVYITLLAVFLALSSPNLGTLVRYRVGFLPFFVLIITANNPLLRWIMAFLERRFPFLGRLSH
jgi:hypothetical protein